MKAKLEFDLENHDDKMAHLRAVKSLDMAIALFDILYNMNNNVKTLDEANEYIRDQLNKNGIIINELID